MNHTLIVSTGSMALLGEEVICLIARSYVLRTERWEDSSEISPVMRREHERESEEKHFKQV